MRHLRDHYDGGTIRRPGRKEGDPLGWSVCMHPEPGAGATAAARVAELPRDPGRGVVAWCALNTPCTSLFLPFAVPVPGALPPALATGTGEPDEASAWWRIEAVGDEVIEDPARRTPPVQAAWQAWERELIAAVARDRATAAAGAADRVERMLAEQRRWLETLGAR
jgi:dipeptidase